MSVLLDDMVTQFCLCQFYTLRGDNMSVSSQVQRWLFIKLLFI